jgi:hypothetical protein
MLYLEGVPETRVYTNLESGAEFGLAVVFSVEIFYR